MLIKVSISELRSLASGLGNLADDLGELQAELEKFNTGQYNWDSSAARHHSIWVGRAVGWLQEQSMNFEECSKHCKRQADLAREINEPFSI